MAILGWSGPLISLLDLSLGHLRLPTQPTLPFLPIPLVLRGGPSLAILASVAFGTHRLLALYPYLAPGGAGLRPMLIF
jgi:hypothetical protein